MKQLVILSGKGGTGKTTVASALIQLAQHKAFADCDVDAPNLHLVYSQGEVLDNSLFYGYKRAVKYDDLCIDCGKCKELCRFGAINNGRVNQYDCEGCGVCEAFCPVHDEDGKPAIRLENNVSGQTYVSKVNGEVFSSAKLKMGNGASGKLVTEVRENLLKRITDEELIIIDGSPGIGCPVIASVTGVDMVLIVAEPTLSGMHDMKRILETARRFGVICLVCINKFDVNIENSIKIGEFCQSESISLLGRIPFDPLVVKAVNSGKTIIEMPHSPAAAALREIWSNLYLQNPSHKPGRISGWM